MASLLMKLARHTNVLTTQNNGVLYKIVRSKVHTYDDWKPGPYPKTEAERKKAAEKYGLSPEEYEPYPDDGCGLGDYPKLPCIGRAAKDYYYPWDDPTYRRNLHEPLHVDDNIMGEDRWDAGVKPPVTMQLACKMFFGTIGGLTLLWYLAEPYPSYHPVMEKQIPKPNVVHYTFEPAH